MSQLFNHPLIFIGLIFLITAIVAFHSLIARRLGAGNASTGRVTMYALIITALLCIAVAILAVTVLPEIVSTLNSGFNIVALGDVILSTQRLTSLTSIFVVLVIATLLFSFLVDLAPLKSFFTVLLGGLATFVATLALTPAYESYMLSRQTDEIAIQQVASVNPSASNIASSKKYSGSLQSKRLALQDMGHNICMCENNLECVKANYTNYKKYSQKHARSYGAKEVREFLQSLQTKVESCSTVIYANNIDTLPSSTEATLEQAITSYYNDHGKWANTYAVKNIQKLESQPSLDNGRVAHVRFRYTPTEYSSKHSDGIDNRIFNYQKNEDGSYTVSAMGTANSANFSTVREIQASYHPLNTDFQIAPLHAYKGKKLKITQLLGEPLEGTLAAYDQNKLTIAANRRDGEIQYQIERSNIANIEVWY